MTDQISNDTIRQTMTEITDTFSASAALADILAAVTAAAVRLIDGATCADVMLVDGDDFQSVAPTSPVTVHLDAVQKQFGEGPCLAAAVGEVLVRSNDFETETRWPRFCASAVEAGIHSALSLQLFTHRRGRGALNIFGTDPHAFDLDDETTALTLATNAAVGLIAVDKQHQFDSALSSRDIIGQAKGMLMERFGIDAIQAVALLTRLSQDSNILLRDIAAQIVVRGPDR
ncbi:GAF and ANTAR domain-containing protein [Antrihabitans sp. YC2-6]|uniref:GAF and ANTAR domain-containing protein n=1 Tax=Antrihabitans sp. YC2-6 TaxID=2799498 RepID=UPI0018F720BA|nr:GAF and ANTAR domain-containing protein [Antrihabitans sp. YC2-6]MBJ8344388.1 GAF and ANTAR domain-containing protein [Antrihabitans sp. YC2-6]